MKSTRSGVGELSSIIAEMLAYSRLVSQNWSKPPEHRSGQRPWMVHDEESPSAGLVSQNWVSKKWPDG